ncbi:MAG TPA: LysR family transcriptional regulator [Casimicrobiaceae bacterium]|nr:LysR family transcriptional regulator [Casimicrobiaceae bacterium]
MIDLRNLEAFLAVSSAGGFTAAAKRLHKTQSAVSQSVRQLEEELGVVLINRTSRFLSLTPAGALLESHATKLFEDATALTALVRERGKAKLQELRFAMVDSFAIAVGPSLIRSMLAEAVNLSLWSELTPRLRGALLEKRADLVVANEAFADAEGLTCFELWREPYVLLLPREIGWDRERLDVASLARAYPVIGYQAPSYMAREIDAQLHRLNVTVSRRVVVDSTEKLVAMVAAGIGWASSTCLSLLRSPELADRIVVAPFPGERFYRHLYMVSRRGELDDLARRLAITAREVLAGPILDEIGRMAPAIRDHVKVIDAPGA